MLELPRIDTIPIEDSISQYVNTILRQNTDWKYCGESSTGMVLLELFDYLFGVQRANMNKISEETVYSFAKFFSMERQRRTPSHSFVSFFGEGTIKKGAKLSTGSMIFETMEEIALSGNICQSIGVFSKDTEKKKADWNPKNIIFGAAKDRIIFEKNNTFVLGLKKALPINKCTRIALVISEKGRNTIYDRDGFIGGGTTKWFFYGEKQGKLDWHEAKLFSDTTRGCLLSGVVSLEIDGQMQPVKNQYLLRCDLIMDGLDRAPVLKTVEMDYVSIRQTDTKCKTVSFTYEEFEKNHMLLKEGFLRAKSLGNGISHRLLIRDAKGYRLAEEYDIYSELVMEQEEIRLVTTNRETIFELLGQKKPNEETLLLTLYEKEDQKDLLSFSSKGTANQSFTLPFVGMVRDDFSIMVADEKEGKSLFRPWTLTKDLGLCSSDANVFSLDEEEGLLSFGDNEHGKIPQKASNKANILVTALSICEGQRGNLKENRDMVLLENPNLFVHHFVASFGGEDRETINNLLLRMKERTKSRTLLTEEDFHKEVEAVEGLLLKSVAVTPMKSANGQVLSNALCIIVEPKYQRGEKLDAISWYLTNIQKRIEEKKLITTKVEVRFAKHIPCNIKLSIVSRTRHSCEQKLRKVLEDFFERLDIGKEIKKSELFRELMKMEEIDKILFLGLELSTRISGIDEFALTLPQDGKAILGELSLSIQEHI